MFEGAEPPQEREYTEAEWVDWKAYVKQEIHYLGKSGKGGKGQRGGGGKGYGGGGKGYGAKGQGTQSQNSGKGRDDWKQDAKDVICLWCHIKGHFRKDCKDGGRQGRPCGLCQPASRQGADTRCRVVG